MVNKHYSLYFKHINCGFFSLDNQSLNNITVKLISYNLLVPG